MQIDNNFQIVEMFEKKLASYLNFKECVCVDSCTDALMIALEAKKLLRMVNKDNCILSVPKHTYLSVPMMLLRNGWKFKFDDREWTKYYLLGCSVFDAAVEFSENLGAQFTSIEDCAVCISFQQKKRFSLDQGGAILTNSHDIATIARRLRHDGRDSFMSQFDEVQSKPDDIILGWHAYMSPEKAAKGLLMMNQLQLIPPYVQHSWKDYPDISQLKCFSTT